jgi:hypothetical protein
MSWTNCSRAQSNSLNHARLQSLGDQAIYYSQFNGSAWAAQQKIPGVGTSPDLVMVAA